MKYNTYLFDFDGTLVDSMPAFVSALVKILDENGIPYNSDTIKAVTPLGYAGTAKYFKERGIKMSESEMVMLLKKYSYNEYENNIPAKPNVIKVLKTLKNSGASLNILTACPHTLLDMCLRRLGIYDLFCNIWSCDDFMMSKTDPRIYLSAAMRLGCEAGEILFLDDNANADRTAKTAGVKVCGVYDETSRESADEIKSFADHYIYDFQELLGLK